MIDPATIRQLADLRRQIDDAGRTAGETLDAMSLARMQAKGLAEATPFLTTCADDLESLAAMVRLAASQVGEPVPVD